VLTRHADNAEFALAMCQPSLIMAVEDQNEPHGLKPTIEDYPFANDGLLLWDAIKEWVTSYVEHYYPQVNLVEPNEELQAWWDEIRIVGHGDKKDGPWWPQLKTQADLFCF
ncbi:linoleate 13S-lipoxygenase 2-1, chloroplastic-like protein, partial [Tanacetum coccineum]